MTDNGTVSRRDLISSAAGIAVAGMAAGSLRIGSTEAEAAAADDAAGAKRGFIDAHSHIWPPDDKKYPLANGKTVADLDPPSFTDDELMAVAGPEGVDRVVLIQHSIYHGFDNSYLVDAYHRFPDRFRVVGMVDSRKTGTGKQMRELLKHGVTGFRITPSILGQDTWLKDAGMQEMWRTAAETRQNMCCLINPRDLPDVGRMCVKFPRTPVVIDHFGRVGIDGRIRPQELQALLDLAEHPTVRVKVSAYYALGLKRPPHDDLLPMIREVVEAFGPERCMWASDCPYQIQGVNNYRASIRAIRDRADFLDDEARDWLLRKTAEETFFFI